ncbi:hypothetical protein CRUP_025582 [Coryphaenoides rupestris]|nr:hypothetical protein CRUP_025582 [Coryphaenoides rupestris]
MVSDRGALAWTKGTFSLSGEAGSVAAQLVVVVVGGASAEQGEVGGAPLKQREISSKVLPFVSGTLNLGKLIPTKKLAVQLEQPATAMAAGRGPWENSSATMNQGMGPGPNSKNATNIMTAKMATRGGDRENINRETVISRALTAIPPRPRRCSVRRPAFSTRKS